jgi:hypothetical protein
LSLEEITQLFDGTEVPEHAVVNQEAKQDTESAGSTTSDVVEKRAWQMK